MSKIRIGTRDSQLAVWQATQVQQLLGELNIESELVYINSKADIDLNTPLYEFGITGVFTKHLDLALINGTIDLAVHSLKDVPTILPKAIEQFAVLPREISYDVLIKGSAYGQETRTVATGSLRRKAYWLNRYPQDHITELRGNVNTRLQKTKENQWHGAILAAAGLKRLNLLPADCEILDWMTPAPAQGVIMVAGLADNIELKALCAQFNDEKAEIEAQIEREFLRTMEGGCTAPIGAKAEFNGESVHFKGEILSLNGQKKLTVEGSVNLDDSDHAGVRWANELLSAGGEQIMTEIRNQS